MTNFKAMSFKFTLLGFFEVTKPEFNVKKLTIKIVNAIWLTFHKQFINK